MGSSWAGPESGHGIQKTGDALNSRHPVSRSRGAPSDPDRDALLAEYRERGLIPSAVAKIDHGAGLEAREERPQGLALVVSSRHEIHRLGSRHRHESFLLRFAR